MIFSHLRNCEFPAHAGMNPTGNYLRTASYVQAANLRESRYEVPWGAVPE